MDYRARLADLVASRSSRVKRVRELIGMYGPMLERYHGGLPVGVLAAIMQMESDGKMDAPGDAALGEVGVFQVTSSFPTKVGVDPQVRYTAEGNIFLGCLEYQYEATRMGKLYPNVRKGSEDQWKLARLAFAIGYGGATGLANRAMVAGSPGAGLFDKIRTYVDTHGGVAFGSQSAEKIWYRVHVVDEVFAIGKEAKFGMFGPPQVIPSPPGVTYQFPSALLPYTGKPTSTLVAVAGGIALAAYMLSRWI